MTKKILLACAMFCGVAAFSVGTLEEAKASSDVQVYAKVSGRWNWVTIPSSENAALYANKDCAFLITYPDDCGGPLASDCVCSGDVISLHGPSLPNNTSNVGWIIQ